MLDRALAKAFAHLSTLVLVACAFTIPLFVGHAFFFRDTLSLREIAPEIRGLPEGQQVRGVAGSDIDTEQRWLLVIAGVSLLTIPLVYRAAHRVHHVEGAGGVATVPDALSHVATPIPRVELSVMPVTGAVAIGFVAAFLTWRIADVVAGLAPDSVSWMLIGLGRAVAASVFIAVGSGTIAALPFAAPAVAPAPHENLDLY